MSDFAPIWTRSSFCADMTCVEVSSSGGAVLIRDGKRASGPVLRLSVSEWDDFRAAVNAGDFRFD